jgi:hypothetical protein
MVGSYQRSAYFFEGEAWRFLTNHNLMVMLRSVVFDREQLPQRDP